MHVGCDFRGSFRGREMLKNTLLDKISITIMCCHYVGHTKHIRLFLDCYNALSK